MTRPWTTFHRPERNTRMACKPDFVQGLPLWMTIPLRSALLRASSRQPGPLAQGGAAVAGARSLFGVAPGGACHAGRVATAPVGSYPTVSPLPVRAQAVCSLWRFPWGCPRRALPGTVTLWSPDFPRLSPRSSGHPRKGDMRGFAAGVKAAKNYGTWDMGHGAFHTGCFDTGARFQGRVRALSAICPLQGELWQAAEHLG